MKYVLACQEEYCVSRSNVLCQGKLWIIRQLNPYNLLLTKILSITDTVLCFKPLVIGLFASFDLFPINKISLPCLL